MRHKSHNDILNLLFTSTFAIISFSSSSVGFCPSDRITMPSSSVVMCPSPSLSNNLKASFSSEKKNRIYNEYQRECTITYKRVRVTYDVICAINILEKTKCLTGV